MAGQGSGHFFGTASHFPETHLGSTIAIAHPMGGHIGAGVAVQAWRSFANDALVPACQVQPPQQASAPSRVSSVTAHSSSRVQAASSGGMVRAPALATGAACAAAGAVVAALRSEADGVSGGVGGDSQPQASVDINRRTSSG